MSCQIIFIFCLLAVVNCHPDPIPGYEIEEPIFYDTFPDGFPTIDNFVGTIFFRLSKYLMKKPLKINL